jgi:hypothetical protein
MSERKRGGGAGGGDGGIIGQICVTSFMNATVI